MAADGPSGEGHGLGSAAAVADEVYADPLLGERLGVVPDARAALEVSQHYDGSPADACSGHGASATAASDPTKSRPSTISNYSTTAAPG
jgi:hypothetical protein